MDEETVTVSRGAAKLRRSDEETVAELRPERKIRCSQLEVMMKMLSVFLPEALFPSERNCKILLRKMCGSNYAVFEEHEELMRQWYYLLRYFNNKSMMKHRIEIHQDEELAALKDNVLFLIGEVDRMSNYPKAIQRLDRNHLEYHILKDTGHAINHERAEEINEAVIDYLLRR